MQARWRFRVVYADRGAEYLAHDGKPSEHFGTDRDALAIAVFLQQQNPKASHIEAVSVGAPTELPEGADRVVVRAEERPDGRGWNLNGEWMSGTWHRRLVEAVEYATNRTRGQVCEIRIQNKRGRVTHVVLIDTRKGQEGKIHAGNG